MALKAPPSVSRESSPGVRSGILELGSVLAVGP
jgi:hypothetical protein